MVRRKGQSSSSTDSRETCENSSIRHRTSGTSAGRTDEEPAKTKSSQTQKTATKNGDRFQKVFGFKKHELYTWEGLIRLLCRPTDPASLGVLRFLFGFLMMLDLLQERGLAYADMMWGPATECRFPLFNFLRPLPLQWMYIVYIVMFLGVCGMMLGFKFRLSCVCFLIPYWYTFFLNKMSWNNHSYLFGILAFLFTISDANRYWSIDGLLNPKINNAHIPLWNYTLMRTQIFLVYFIAGLKKLDHDWLYGYSMQSLSEHWIFDPFKLVLTGEQIDLYIIHLGGLFIDLSVGYLLFFDKTRLLGLFICSSFNIMNSQIFQIGMFPYAMLAVQLLFLGTNWPRRLFKAIPPTFRLFTPEERDFQLSPHCVYTKQDIKSENVDVSSLMSSKEALPTSPRQRHKFTTVFTVLFIAWQVFLPYSHGITKGYNNWTNGLYGYSWDMMVHSWRVQHVRLTYFDKDTGDSGYMDPTLWTGGSERWTSHPDMIKQYASCIKENLRSYNINNVEIYFDIWKSLNSRFQQRVVNPNVDIVTAEWHPFQQTSWVMPLMVDLSDWRAKLAEIEGNFTDDKTNYIFIADFPGMHLENFVHPDFTNTTLTVLDGQVLVEQIDKGENVTLGPGESVQIQHDAFHNVHTISETPSCYMYLYVNTTEIAFMQKYSIFEEEVNNTSLNETLKKYNRDPNLWLYQDYMKLKKQEENEKAHRNLWGQFKSFLYEKYKLFRRSLRLSTGAVYCLATNSSFDEFLNATYQWETRRDETAAIDM